MHSRRVAGEKVVYRIANEDGVFGRGVEAVERYPNRFWVGLMPSGRVTAHNRIHVASQPDMCQAAHSQRLGFAGDDADVVTASLEEVDRLDDLVVASGEAVVMDELVFSIRGNERGAVGLVAGVAAEHREKRDADAGEPFLVGWYVALELLKCEAGRIEDQLDRIDERSVEVEEDGWEATRLAAAHGHGHLPR